MTDSHQENLIELIKTELGDTSRSEWEEPIICRVEIDLPAWLSQLTGRPGWEVYLEEEAENCTSFAMRQGTDKSANQAEVTLYHNGYAVVDVDGRYLFDGSLTSGSNDYAHLTYYNASSGEKITLN